MNELLLLLVLGVSIAGVVLIAMLITKERTSAREARDELNRIMSSFAGVQNAQFEALRGAVEQRLERIQQDNSAKLEQMRQTLEQMLTPEQYETNVATRPGSRERVEFAIKLPGHDPDTGTVWLPIDAKFPLEDYQRLQDAREAADPAAMEAAAKALEVRVRLEARSIAEKYVEPPATTDFALLYLPFEGLYAEVLRQPGLFEQLQRDCRVTVCGPTTLSA